VQLIETGYLQFSQSVVTIEEEYLILAEPRVSLVACEQRIPSFLYRAVRGANLCGTTRLRLAVGASNLITEEKRESILSDNVRRSARTW
jgi:hypothetical protein